MVRFWDTSAIMPLLVDEPGTPFVRPLLEGDEWMAVWWGSRTECVSALSRRQRDRQLTAKTVRDARRVLQALAKSWAEVQPTESVRKSAERLLAVHPLRAADAMQLAAALLWCRDDPEGHEFVCLDERLTAAAAREGFEVLTKT